MITAAELAEFAPGANPYFAPALSGAASQFEITGPRLAHWLGQCHHESQGFTRLSENLNYGAVRLVAVWPSRFPTAAAAQPFANNPAALANKVYGGRMGNTEPGDGWTFRGRGPIQITGRDMYRQAGEALGQPLEHSPEMVMTPTIGALTAAWVWFVKGLNALADADDIEGITRRINGGLEGLDARRHEVAVARLIWPA